MTQPDFVPLVPEDRVRPSLQLRTPPAWRQGRPGELLTLLPPEGPSFGATGADLGYGLKLARRFEDRLELMEGEKPEDAVWGCFAAGARRASHFHRAPIVHDMEWAYTLWGFLGGAPEDLVHARAELFRGAAHGYWEQRRVVDAVREAALPLTPLQVRERLASWHELIEA